MILLNDVKIISVNSNENNERLICLRNYNENISINMSICSTN